LSAVLYGFKTWSLTLREELSLRVFENRVLRKIFGPKRDEGAGDWRKLHEEELDDLYWSPNIYSIDQIKKNKMGVACSAYGRLGRYIQGSGGGNLGERRILGELSVNVKIILKNVNVQEVEWGQELDCSGSG
jgi:hypothetical protein